MVSDWMKSPSTRLTAGPGEFKDDPICTGIDRERDVSPVLQSILKDNSEPLSVTMFRLFNRQTNSSKNVSPSPDERRPSSLISQKSLSEHSSTTPAGVCKDITLSGSASNGLEATTKLRKSRTALSKSQNHLIPPTRSFPSKQSRQDDPQEFQDVQPIDGDPLHTTDPATFEQASRVPGYATHESNPFAKEAMQSSKFRETRTAVSDNFIEGFYKNSRLHYLSTWKSEMKNIVAKAQAAAEEEYVDELKAEGSFYSGYKSSSTLKGKAKEDGGRLYMHCDFDSFFVAVGLLDRPHLKGKPTVVCHSQGSTGGASSTSEVASASYEARAHGVKNGMRQAAYCVVPSSSLKLH
jgi:hypothetical protein